MTTHCLRLFVSALVVASVGCAGSKPSKIEAPRFSASAPVQAYHAIWVGLYEGTADASLLAVDRRVKDGEFTLNIEYVHPHIVITGWLENGSYDAIEDGLPATQFVFAAPADDPLRISGRFSGFYPDSEDIVCSLHRAEHTISGIVRSYKKGGSDPDAPLRPTAKFEFEVALQSAEPKFLHGGARD